MNTSPEDGGREPSITHNFTPRAQQTLALARKEADRFHHNFVGTEHLLLGIIRLGQGVAVSVLQKMGVDLESVRVEVEKQVRTGPDQQMVGNIPYSPRVKKVLALAAKEAEALKHTYVGTEHILLGLLREGDGVAARVLKQRDVDPERTRQEILKELDPNFQRAAFIGTPEAPQPARSPKSQSGPVDTSKRYDIYCKERDHEVVVYRNALFKGCKKLLREQAAVYDIFYEFLELEQPDGQTLFVPRSSVVKFCEHGMRPGGENVPGLPTSHD